KSGSRRVTCQPRASASRAQARPTTPAPTISTWPRADVETSEAMEAVPSSQLEAMGKRVARVHRDQVGARHPRPAFDGGDDGGAPEHVRAFLRDAREAGADDAFVDEGLAHRQVAARH